LCWLVGSPVAVVGTACLSMPGCSACQPVLSWPRIRSLYSLYMLLVVSLTCVLQVCCSCEGGGALSFIGGTWFGSLSSHGVGWASRVGLRQLQYLLVSGLEPRA
jgi:hypothetical protein